MKKIIIAVAATIIASVMVLLSASPIATKAAKNEVSAPAQRNATMTTSATLLTTSNINKDQALQIALHDAGLAKDEVILPTVRKNFEDGINIWEVKFHVGYSEYNYDIAVDDGQIVDFDLEV